MIRRVLTVPGADGAELMAVVHEPVGPPLSVTILLAGGVLPRMGVNRVLVRMADRLAAAGHRVVRVDPRGLGESGGSLTEEPFFDLLRRVESGAFVDDVRRTAEAVAPADAERAARALRDLRRRHHRAARGRGARARDRRDRRGRAAQAQRRTHPAGLRAPHGAAARAAPARAAAPPHRLGPRAPRDQAARLVARAALLEQAARTTPTPGSTRRCSARCARSTRAACPSRCCTARTTSCATRSWSSSSGSAASASGRGSSSG